MVRLDQPVQQEIQDQLVQILQLQVQPDRQVQMVRLDQPVQQEIQDQLVQQEQLVLQVLIAQ
jgi:hypothetical protein